MRSLLTHEAPDCRTITAIWHGAHVNGQPVKADQWEWPEGDFAEPGEPIECWFCHRPVTVAERDGYLLATDSPPHEFAAG